MNESETRAELIDPRLKEAGWGVVEGSKILREYKITEGRIQAGGRGKPLIADYILSYRNRKLAVVEAKSANKHVSEGVAQAKLYADKLKITCAYATNGNDIYAIDMDTGKEGPVTSYPTPEELWNRTFGDRSTWREAFTAVPFEDVGGTRAARYYQEIAVNKTMEAIAAGRQRVLLTLATGTGKTFIAFQIAWKLFKSRWTLQRDGKRQPRILFLADRNILANQAYNSFSAFPEDALARIKPDEIRKKGRVLTNGSVFFTIFQTFMSGTDKDGKPAPYFGEYPKDFFDFIIVDECHRGGANDESNWRGILDYFAPAVQLGLTATPKRKDNADTYRYFGEPVYVYSLKDGINDGFLTPFKVKRVQTTLDSYIYVADDTVIEGEVEQGREYVESDFNRIIEIADRERKRVQIMMDSINQNEKAIVFCATQTHAGVIRDLINQHKKSTHPDYCVRVTANDGAIGETFLEQFQDNDRTIPTILTTSQKLSTGVDARNIRNVVLMRPVNSMIEFKQIVGRGTRLFEGKDFFTIWDYVDAYKHFADPEWDGEPLPPDTETEPCTVCGQSPCVCGKQFGKTCAVCGQIPCVCEKKPHEPCEVCGEWPCVCGKKPRKVKIALAPGKFIEIQHMIATSFWSADGKPISAEEFMQNLYGAIPSFFRNEHELRSIWSDPATRRTLLERLSDAGYARDDLATLQSLVNAEKSDLFDVLEYISYSRTPITREARVAFAHSDIVSGLTAAQKEFVEFVLSKYIESGVDELDQAKLPKLLELKYESVQDAAIVLGGVESIRQVFTGFQKALYGVSVA
jgi:type I restriction enzyme R subunit